MIALLALALMSTPPDTPLANAYGACETAIGAIADDGHSLLFEIVDNWGDVDCILDQLNAPDWSRFLAGTVAANGMRGDIPAGDYTVVIYGDAMFGDVVAIYDNEVA